MSPLKPEVTFTSSKYPGPVVPIPTFPVVPWTNNELSRDVVFWTWKDPVTANVEVGALVEEKPTPTFPPVVRRPPTLMESVVVAELNVPPAETMRLVVVAVVKEAFVAETSVVLREEPVIVVCPVEGPTLKIWSTTPSWAEKYRAEPAKPVPCSGVAVGLPT